MSRALRSLCCQLEPASQDADAGDLFFPPHMIESARDGKLERDP